LVIDIAKTVIYPAAIQYLSSLASTAAGVASMGIELDTSVASAVADSSGAMLQAVNMLSAAVAKEDFASTEEHMMFCAYEIRPLMEEIRQYADLLETEVADDLWPLPKYQEMLFIK
jgi:glutamine synthetase